jgi:hypothetical protein
MGLRIFISYGHDEHAELARQLQRVLETRGHEVWFDEMNIKGGQDWEAAIEEGLKATDVVLALLTPHAVRRPDGVCLDELSFARFMRRKIVPLMVQWCAPPLSISRLQWLNFQDWRASDERYQRQVAQLVEVVEGARAIDFEGSQARLLNTLDPLDYGVEIERFLRGFSGRTWLLDHFEQWLGQADHNRIFFITGLPGIGKSAVASFLCHKHPSVVAYHFCEYRIQEKSNALRCVLSLAYQLSTQLPDYRDLLLAENLDKRPIDAFSAFDRLIAQPLHKLTRPDRTYVIIIDALDEATSGGRNELVDLLASQFDKTPSWLRLVITSRPEPLILRTLSKLKPYQLEGHPRHLSDVRDFLRGQLGSVVSHDRLLDTTVETIVNKSEGNFLYATIVLGELREGRLSIDHVDEFPQGLTGIYTYWFKRYFPDLQAYKDHQRPLLELVAAAKAPVPVELAAWALDWDDYQQDEALEPLGTLFPEIDATLRPFHRSVIDWLGQRKQAGGYRVRPRKYEEGRPAAGRSLLAVGSGAGRPRPRLYSSVRARPSPCPGSCRARTDAGAGAMPARRERVPAGCHQACRCALGRGAHAASLYNLCGTAHVARGDHGAHLHPLAPHSRVPDRIRSTIACCRNPPRPGRLAPPGTGANPKRILAARPRPPRPRAVPCRRLSRRTRRAAEVAWPAPRRHNAARR